MTRQLSIPAFVLAAGLALSTPGQAEDSPVALADLVRALKNPDAGLRAKAAAELGRRDDLGADATAALKAALQDPARAVRARAAVALRTADAAPVVDLLPGLLAARNDPDDAVRAAADDAWAGIGVGVRAALPFVKRSLAAQNDGQALPKAIAALSKPGLEAFPAILDAVAEERGGAGRGSVYTLNSGRSQPFYSGLGAGPFLQAAVEAMAKSGTAGVPTLDEALADGSPSVREVAATVLGKLGAAARPAVPTLIGLFDDRDPAIRQRAAEAVGLLGPAVAETIPALTAALSHRDPVVRRAAVTALAQVRPVQAGVTAALGKALDDPEPFVRLKAAETLCLTDPPPAAALATLAEELRGRDAATRTQAGQLLEKMGTKALPAGPALRAMTRDRDRLARVAAARVLVKLGVEDIVRGKGVLREALADEDVAVRVRAAEALWDQGAVKEAAPVLLAALGSTDQAAVGVANQVLGRLRPDGPEAKELVPAMVDALGDDTPNVRNQVLNYLSRLGKAGQPAAPAVARLLRSGDDNTRQTALSVLQSIGGATKEAVPDLVQALRSPNPSVRNQVAELIRGLGPDAKAAVPALKELLKDGSFDAKLQALRVLHRVSPAEVAAATPVLLELVKSKDTNVRYQAFQLVGEVGAKDAKGVLPVVLEALKSADPQVRSMATSALSQMQAGGRPEVRAALREMLRAADPEVRLMAASQLEQNRGGQSPNVAEDRSLIAAALTEVVTDAKVAVGVRLRAVEILRRHGEEGRRAGLPTVREGLKDTDPNTRLQAARLMLQPAYSPDGGSPTAESPDDYQRAVVVVAELLRAGPAQTRSTALYTLQNAPPAALRFAAEGIHAALADPQPQTRLMAAQMLVKLDGKDLRAGMAALAELATDRRQEASYVRPQALRALRALGPDGEKIALPVLVDMLKDPALRAQAAAELTAMNPAAAKVAVPVLKEMLADPQAGVRLQAAQLLIRSGGGEAEVKAATDALVGLLTEKQGAYHRAAAAALENLGPKWAKVVRPAYVEMLADPQPTVRLDAARRLVSGATADERKVLVPVLRELMGPGRSYERVQAAELLVQADPDRAGEAAKVLLELVKDPQAQYQVIAALGRLGPAHSAEVVPVVREMLKSPDRSTRQQGMSLVSQLGPVAKELVPDLAGLVADPEIATAAIHALGRAGAAGLPHLTKLLDSDAKGVRLAAVHALGQPGPDARTAVPRLTQLLADPDTDPQVKTAAQFALQRIGPGAAADLIGLLADPDPVARLRAALALGTMSTVKDVLPALEKAAADPDLGVRMAAARSAYAGGSRTKGVVAGVADGLKATAPGAKAAAVAALHRADSVPDGLVAALEELLADPDRGVRVGAAGVLARTARGAAAAGPVLAAALNEPAVQGRAVAALTMPEVRPAALKAAAPVLRELLKKRTDERNRHMLGQIALALARAGGPDVVPLLADAAADSRPGDPVDQFTAALGECGPTGVAALRKLLPHANPNVRMAVLDQLGPGARLDPSLVPDLVARLDDSEVTVRYRALLALGSAGPAAKAAAAAVAGRLKDTDPRARLEAALALARIGEAAGRADALALLRDELRKPDIGFASHARAAEAIGLFGAAAAAAVPDLLPLLDRPAAVTRSRAAEALGRIGKPAQAAVRPLTEQMAGADLLVRAHAAVALWRITGDAGPVVPVLAAVVAEPSLQRTVPIMVQPFPGGTAGRPFVSRVNRPGTAMQYYPAQTYYTAPMTRPASDQRVHLIIVATLAEIGPAAKAAAPALKRMTQNGGDADTRAAATAALRKILPDADPKPPVGDARD